MQPSTLPAFRFTISEDPKDRHPLAPTFDRPPLSVLVIGDVTQRDDMRPLEDKRAMRLTPDNVVKCMLEQRLALAPDKLGFAGEAGDAGEGAANLNVPNLRGLRFRRLDDFSANNIRGQLREQLSADGATLDQLVEQLVGVALQAPALQRLRSSWHSLVDSASLAGPDVRLELVNCSTEDLVMEFEDAPSVDKSGLWRPIHHYNHLGMRPYSAVVLLGALGHEPQHVYLLEQLSQVAAASHLVVIAEADPALDSNSLKFAQWSRSLAARNVALCAPASAVRTEFGSTPGATALLVTQLMCASYERLLSAHGLASNSIPLGRRALSQVPDAPNGLMTLLAAGDELRIGSDSSCYRGSAASNSIAERLLCVNVAHLAQRAHAVRCAGWYSKPAQEQVDIVNDGLRVRLSALRDIHAQLVNANRGRAWIDATLEISLSGDRPAHYDEPIRLRDG